MRKTICALALGLAIAIGGCKRADTPANEGSKYSNTEELSSQEKKADDLTESWEYDSNLKDKHSKTIEGYVGYIDEDFLIVEGNSGTSGSFQYETIHVKTSTDSDKKVYYLVHPGPSSYHEGQHVSFRYVPKSKVFYREITDFSMDYPHTRPVQNGYVMVDGIIKL